MRTPKPICKSYTLQGSNGHDLVVSETVDRLEIDVSIRGRETNNEVASLRITGEQFQLLCRLDSTYEGLEVRKILRPVTDDEPPSELEVVAAAREFLDEEVPEGGDD